MKGFIALLIGFAIGLIIDNQYNFDWEHSSTIACSMLLWGLYSFCRVYMRYHVKGRGGDSSYLGDGE